MGCGASAPSDSEKFRHDGFVIHNSGEFRDFYELGEKLGSGATADVYLCTNKATGAVRAVKCIDCLQVPDSASLRREIEIMKLMDHPNIVRIHEDFTEYSTIHLVLELCTGGELFDYIVEHGHLTETQAAMLMESMLKAAFYMHQNCVCHRDFKPENFLFASKEASIEQSHLKLSDFGLATKCVPGSFLEQCCGTPEYLAPEVLSGSYDCSADMWSLGVIMYVLLCGYTPFRGDTEQQIFKNIRKGAYSFNYAAWANVSDDAKDMIRALLTKNPLQRQTAEQALNHVWVKHFAPKAATVLSDSLICDLRDFQGKSKLQKAVRHAIAAQLDDSKTKALRDAFMTLDKNGDGLLTAQEIAAGFSSFKIDVPADLKQLVQEVDTDGNGGIDFTEFLAAAIGKKACMAEDTCWQAFQTFDRDGDGKIGTRDLAKVFRNRDNAEMSKLVSEADMNNDGEIDFPEFCKMMRSTTAATESTAASAALG